MKTLPQRRWTRVEYERLIDVGIFQPGERLELLAGHLVVREPQDTPHATALGLVEDVLREVFGPGWVVRTQMPVALDDDSEPEPDVAVVPGSRRDYELEHPSRPVLVVEIADSSLAIDRTYKTSLYARAGVPEYWIVNLASDVLEVRRNPGASPEAPLGWGYGSLAVLVSGDTVSPLAAPTALIVVANLLPRRRPPR
jgi:Uma2 family endonuclease